LKKPALYILSFAPLMVASAASAQELAPPPPMGQPQQQQMQPMPPMQPMQPPPPQQQPQPGGGQAPLAPPPPMDPNAQNNPNGQGDTKQKLEAADKADNGRGFELIYVNGDIGASYINMTSFSSSADKTSFGFQTTQSAGPGFQLAAGVRLVFLTLGVRARLNQLSAFSLWQLNAEVGLKSTMGSLDLFGGVHGGYDFLGSLDKASLSSDTDTQQSSGNVTVRGWNAGLDAGLDYYLVPMFSLGFVASADFLQLNRPPISTAGLDPTVAAKIQADPNYSKSGQSDGFGLMGAVRLGLHFGL
jgi:hypothetical protein